MYPCLWAQLEDNIFKYNSACWTVLARLCFMMKYHCHFPGLEKAFCMGTFLPSSCYLIAITITVCVTLLFVIFF